MKLTILFPVEFFERDYLPSLLLAETITKNFEVECIIGPQTLLQRCSTEFNDYFVYFDKSLASSKGSFVRNLSKKCIYLSSDAEYSSIVNGGDYYLQTRFDEMHAQRAKKIIPATLQEFELLSANFNNVSEHVLPFRQLSHLRFAKFYGPELNQIKKKFGKFDLVVSSFGGHHRPGGISDLYEWSESHFSDQSSKINFRAKIMRREKLRSDFAKFLRSHFNKFPNKSFVLRPHPRETEESWKFYDFPENVIISKAYDITPMLLCANNMIHAGCTTGLERYFMGMSNVFYHSSHTDYNVYDFYKQYSNQVVTNNELLKNEFYKECNEKLSNVEPRIVDIVNSLKLEQYKSKGKNFLYLLRKYNLVRPSYKRNGGKTNRKTFAKFALLTQRILPKESCNIYRDIYCVKIK